MAATMQFGDVLDAVDNLELEEQQELVAVVKRRIAERGRERLVAAVEEARREHAAGLSRPITPAEIIAESYDGEETDECLTVSAQRQVY